MTVSSREQTSERTRETPKAALLEAFLHVDPEAAEPVRQRHCSVCRLTAGEGKSPLARRQTCDQWRCGLRDPERFRFEQEWALATLLLFANPATSTDAALANLNHYLAAAGCATVGVMRGPQGRITFGVNASTLRGELHATIVGWLAMKVGAMTRDLSTMTITEAQSAFRGRRESRAEMARRRAAALRVEGLSDKQIAKQLKVDPKTIRNWLGKREEG